MKKILIDYIKKFTDLSDKNLEEIAKQVPMKSFKKGTILLHQGEIPKKCYFVLKGCVRQYSVDEGGKESTFNFFTESTSINIFNHHELDKSSKYTLTCLEDSYLVIGDLSTEEDMYDNNPFLREATISMIEEDMGRMQDEFATYISSDPEKRYLALIKNRPGLVDRVPQHQLASYLGITPESLSRIKRRLTQSHLKLVD